MYCVNCGVKLSDSEKECPLCHTRVFHPDIEQPAAEGMYPDKKYPQDGISSRLPLIIITVTLLLPLLIVLWYDLQHHGTVTWSGYVIGAIIMGYIIAVLPAWFKNPNPVIFVPCDFAAAGLYLLYISLMTGGGWFLSFAFPVVGGTGLIVTAVTVLLRYCRRGALYIIGGASCALGVFMLLVEFLMTFTFRGVYFIGWSLYPLITLVLLGGMLIFLAICRPAREIMERKFFI